MALVALALSLVALVLAISNAAGARDPRPDPPPANFREEIGTAELMSGWILEKIDQARARAHACERELGLPLTPVSREPISGWKYAKWTLGLWKQRERVTCALVDALRDPRAAIRAVFGPIHGPGAIVVSSCESHLRTTAVNGQYLGMFQMGAYARGRYGHGETVLEQTVAAHRYFVASGSDWSPWQCRPNGGLGWS